MQLFKSLKKALGFGSTETHQQANDHESEPKETESRTSDEGITQKTDVYEMFKQEKEVLEKSKDPFERLKALNRLSLLRYEEESANDSLQNLIIHEYLETLKNDYRGELAFMAAIALAGMDCKEKVKDKLHSLFEKNQYRMSTAGRNLQTAVCYPLLLMKDSEFFRGIDSYDFRPTPPGINVLIEAGRQGDSEKSLHTIVFYEGMEDMQNEPLFKEVMNYFKELNIS